MELLHVSDIINTLFFIEICCFIAFFSDNLRKSSKMFLPEGCILIKDNMQFNHNGLVAFLDHSDLLTVIFR